MPVNTIQDRVRSQTQAISTPMACKACGSTYFADGHAHQYSNQGYGSAQFRQISVTPVNIKQCIGCGKFVYPDASGGAVAPGSSPQFQESIRSGKEYLDKQALNANAVASKKELDVAQERVNSLEKHVHALEKELASVREELLEAVSEKIGPLEPESAGTGTQTTPTKGKKNASRAQAPSPEHK